MKGNFQLIILIIFIALAIFGVLVFSGAIPIGKNSAPGGLGTVLLWGTARADVMAPILEEFNNANQTFVVKYAQKSADIIDQDLLEALATGTGPDMFFLPDNLAYHYANKNIYPRKYSWLPRTFNEFLIFSLFIISNLLIIPNIIESIRKTIKTQDNAWLLHPIAIFLITLMYGIIFILTTFKK